VVVEAALFYVMGNSGDFLNPKFEPFVLVFLPGFVVMRGLRVSCACVAVIGITGCRAGEILGLQVSDLDFDKFLIRIRRTLDDSTRQMSSPKSKASSADLPMPAVLADRLRKFLADGWRENESGLLFCNSKGKPMQRSKVAIRLQATLKGLGIQKAALHAFRHMAASELLEAGAAPSVVQRQMRHSDARITLQGYGHVIGDAQRRAVNSLANRVLGN